MPSWPADPTDPIEYSAIRNGVRRLEARERAKHPSWQTARSQLIARVVDDIRHDYAMRTERWSA